MKLKMNEQGQPVLQDGHPVYVYDDGKEVAVNVAELHAKVHSLNGESAGRRKRIEELEALNAKFQGIEDPAAALKALETLKSIDAKKLVDAGEVERLKADILRGAEETWGPKYKAAEERAEKAEKQLYQEMIGGAFARSKFITEKMAIPADFVQAALGQYFKIEDGHVVAYHPSGERMMSRTKVGDPAGFDEGLEVLVMNHPRRDSLLKSSLQGGGGAPSNGGGGTGVKSMRREIFDSLAPPQKAVFLSAGGKVTD